MGCGIGKAAGQGDSTRVVGQVVGGIARQLHQWIDQLLQGASLRSERSFVGHCVSSKPPCLLLSVVSLLNEDLIRISV